MSDIVERLVEELRGLDESTSLAVFLSACRRAADTIETLRSIAGNADVGPSFSDMTSELRHEAPRDTTGW